MELDQMRENGILSPCARLDFKIQIVAALYPFPAVTDRRYNQSVGLTGMEFVRIREIRVNLCGFVLGAELNPCASVFIRG